MRLFCCLFIYKEKGPREMLAFYGEVTGVEPAVVTHCVLTTAMRPKIR